MSTEQHIELLDQAGASVLGAALTSEADCARVVARLSEEDFRRDAHRTMFRAIASQSRAGKHGTVAVTEWLIDAGDIDHVGGPAAVSDLASRVVSRQALEDRLDKLHQASYRRRLHRSASKVAEAAADWQTSRADLQRIAVEGLLEAQMGSASQVVRLSDRREQVEAILKAGTTKRSVSTGWRTLDKHYQPAPGRWTLLTGIPGHGKSALLDAMMFNLAAVQGWRFLICSPEKEPIEQHIAQLVQLRVGRQILRRGVPAQGADVDEAKEWVEDRFAWIELGDDARDVQSLLAMARVEHVLSPFDGLTIDPWNELDHSRDKALSETEHVSQALTLIRAFSRKMDVHTWLVAHPTKLRKSERTDRYPVPTPYDVSGSAHWRNKADNALSVWRDHADISGWSQVHVQKVRTQPDDGTEGMVELKFDPTTGRFDERSAW